MKPIFKTLLLGALFISICTACSSDDEPSWDKTWDEEIIKPGDKGYVRADTHFVNSDVILNGKYVRSSPELLETLKKEAALPAKYPVDVRVSAHGELKEAIGRHALEMDSLTVVGPLSNNDIRYIRLCVCSGKLRKVNLAKATLENNTLPEGAFYGSEFNAAQVPLLSLVLPESIERLGDCSLCQTLITEIDLPDGIVLEPGCLANTPMLGGEITIGKNTVIETADLPCCSAFVSAGNGTLVINYQAKVINNDFASSYIKEFNTDEGVEEIKAGALSNLPVETLTLSKSLKKIGEGALQNLSKVKTMYINFTDASVLGFTIDELNEDAEGPDFDLEEWLERVPLRGLPLDATIYVPKGSKEALCRSVALDDRNLVEVD